jgi:hypothetical protein
MTYQSREPHTPMEWAQEQTEAMYAREDRWLLESRFEEAPINDDQASSTQRRQSDDNIRQVQRENGNDRMD